MESNYKKIFFGFVLFLLIVSFVKIPNNIVSNNIQLNNSNQISSVINNNNLFQVIQKNIARVDKNHDKISDTLNTNQNKLNLIITYDNSNFVKQLFKYVKFTNLRIFNSLPFLSLSINKNQLPILKALSGLLLIENNAQVKQDMVYSTNQMDVRQGVWNLGYHGSSKFSIAIIDSGIDTTHTAFQGRIVATYNAITGTSDVTDKEGHGTHVAGIAAGLPITGTDSYSQSVRSTFVTDGYFTPEILISNLNKTSNINVGLDWKDTNGNAVGTAGIYLYTSNLIYENQATTSNGYIQTTFTNVPSGSYYVGFGSVSGAQGLAYEGWANVTYDSTLPSEIHTDAFPKDAGIAYGTNIVAVKALDNTGSGTASEILNAINWVISNKLNYNITVVNLSFGAGQIVSSLDSAMADLAMNGIVPVVSAGNDGANSGGIFSPASAPEAITVGAVNRFNEIAYYSSAGSSIVNNPYMKPDVLAPGGSATLPSQGDISSYAPGMGLVIAPDTNYGTKNNVPNDLVGFQGTSMAAPQVSGIAAILTQIIDQKQGWQWTESQVFEVKRMILTGTFEVANIGHGSETLSSGSYGTAHPVINRNGRDYYEGWGAVDAGAIIDGLVKQMPYTPQNLIFSLQNPFGKKVYAWNLNAEANAVYTFSATVPSGCDVDLLVYDPNTGQYGNPTIIASSLNGTGINELLHISVTTAKNLVLVAKLVNSSNASDNVTIQLSNPNFIPKMQITQPTNNSYINKNTVPIFFDSVTNNAIVYDNNVQVGNIASGDSINLSEGLHNITLEELNTNTGQSATDTIFITIDLTNPIISSSNLSTFTTISDISQISLNASDNIGIGRITLLDSNRIEYEHSFSNIVANVNNFNISLNPFHFTFGSHNVTLEVQDLAGNIATISQIINFNQALYLTPIANGSIEYNKNNILTWFAGINSTLSSPQNYYISINGTIVENSAWTGSNITLPVNGLNLGNLLINVTVVSSTRVISSISLIKLVDTTYPVISGLYSGILDATINSYQMIFSVNEQLPKSLTISVDGVVIKNLNNWNGASSDTTFTINSKYPELTTSILVTVIDTSNHVSTALSRIKWEDLTPPSISSPSDLTFPQGSASSDIVWSVTEKFMLSYHVLIDNSEYNTGNKLTNSEYTIAKSVLDNLAVGSHTITFNVTDYGNHTVGDIVKVNVTVPNNTSNKNSGGFLPFMEINSVLLLIPLYYLISKFKEIKNR